jgi:hypothetical protein
MLAALDAALAPRFVRGHDVKAVGYLPTVQSAPELQSGYREMNLATELPGAPGWMLDLPRFSGEALAHSAAIFSN